MNKVQLLHSHLSSSALFFTSSNFNKKAKPKIIKYRDFSKYNKARFGNDLGNKLQNQPSNYETFDKIFLYSGDGKLNICLYLPSNAVQEYKELLCATIK